MAGNEVAARAVDHKIARLHKDLFLESNPIPVKWALKEMGLIGPGIRLPLVELDPQYHDALRDALRSAGVL
jgi:4-hydroxy-tetrahydrodipicolinate synthase